MPFTYNTVNVVDRRPAEKAAAQTHCGGLSWLISLHPLRYKSYHVMRDDVFMISHYCLVCTCHAAKVEMASSDINNYKYFHYDAGCRGIEIHQVSSPTVFFFVSYMHIHVPFIMYCSGLFVVAFREMNCLHMALFVGSQSYISPPSFMFVSAVVSEIRELNQTKKKEKEVIPIYTVRVVLCDNQWEIKHLTHL